MIEIERYADRNTQRYRERRRQNIMRGIRARMPENQEEAS